MGVGEELNENYGVILWLFMFFCCHFSSCVDPVPPPWKLDTCWIQSLYSDPSFNRGNRENIHRLYTG